MKKLTAIGAAWAATGLLALSACAGQDDLSQAINDSVQAATQTFVDELRKAMAKPVAALTETGSTSVKRPDAVDIPEWVYAPAGESPPEPGPDEPPETRMIWEAGMAAWEAHRAALAESWSVSQAYVEYDGWGFWATLGREPLFKATLDGRSRGESNYCRLYGGAECAGWVPHELDVVIEGTPTGTNPIAGAAVWLGFARAVSESGAPREGTARLEADLGAGQIDVLLSGLEEQDLSWPGLAMTNGVFARVDLPADGQTLGWSIEGAFYGPDHEGVAGKFTKHRTVGVFGALRE